MLLKLARIWSVLKTTNITIHDLNTLWIRHFDSCISSAFNFQFTLFAVVEADFLIFCVFVFIFTKVRVNPSSAWLFNVQNFCFRLSLLYTFFLSFPTWLIHIKWQLWIWFFLCRTTNSAASLISNNWYSSWRKLAFYASKIILIVKLTDSRH